MAYTYENFKTKKALKEAVIKQYGVEPYFTIRCYQSGLGPDLSNYTGKVHLEGPHYPKAHTWYAEAELMDGVVIKVK